MAFEVDPISQIYAKLVSIIKAQPGLANLPAAKGKVQPARIVNLLDAIPNVNAGQSGAETPDIIVSQAGRVLNPNGRNSLVASLVADFPIGITDGHPSIGLANQVEWLVFKALFNAPPKLGLDFVTSWQMLAGNSGPGSGGSKFVAASRKWHAVSTVRVLADIERRLIV
jgi:hypothetical protein